MLYSLDSDVNIYLLPNNEACLLPVPTWRLADWSLQVGGFKNGYELEESATSSLGSYSYGWLSDAVDTMLFSPTSKILHTILLNIPESLSLVNNNIFSLNRGLDKKGSICLESSKKFKLNSCHLSKYLWVDDVLLLLIKDEKIADNHFAANYDVSIEVAKGLYILFKSNKYIGWLFKNASSCISNDAPQINRFERAKYLKMYLSYFANDIKEKLEDEDVAVKLSLNRFRNKLQSQTGGYMREIQIAVENLLETYY